LRQGLLKTETSIIIDTPVYLTHTSLSDDFQNIGRIPYRFVLLQFSDTFSLTLLTDPSLDLSELSKVFLLIIYNFLLVREIAHWHLNFRRPSCSFFSGSITVWPFSRILALFRHSDSLIVHSGSIHARMYKFIPINANSLRRLIFSLRRS